MVSEVNFLSELSGKSSLNHMPNVMPESFHAEDSNKED
jgi:hypothetical protein